MRQSDAVQRRRIERALLNYDENIDARPQESKFGKMLTPELAQEIRTVYMCGGGSYRALGERFGVSRATIQHIVLNKTWRVCES